MAKDSVNLIKYLGLRDIAIMGYSMGARISAYVSMTAPELIKCAVFGGLGERMTIGMTTSGGDCGCIVGPQRLRK